ncbi:MAG TPA: tRNA (N6-threonylcarbamoyladenosine(37)-N6)-methyltransferase TrmO [Candidatus Limnocylindrales bacterium]|nr:tRNA (N6-threonylcarbamoyladenosine(37)-N6)-methyltransferase TrmO [Candidatus Limnocylindrales bacterium]
MLPTIAELRIVGLARTPWTRREDAPHQPSAVPDSFGTLEIEQEYREALADLGSFERIWILFLFDRSRGWSATVKPPRGGPRRGVFATRAPNRPSQIGLSNVAVREVRQTEGLVHVHGIDLLDGTPILDIKPYLAGIDAHPHAGNGWLQPYLDAGIEPRLKKPYRPPR